MLWLNWSEVKIPIGKILPLFRDWNEMLRLEVGSQKQTLSEYQNYWIMFMKNPSATKIHELTAFATKPVDQEGE